MRWLSSVPYRQSEKRLALRLPPKPRERRRRRGAGACLHTPRMKTPPCGMLQNSVPPRRAARPRPARHAARDRRHAGASQKTAPTSLTYKAKLFTVLPEHRPPSSRRCL